MKMASNTRTKSSRHLTKAVKTLDENDVIEKSQKSKSTSEAVTENMKFHEDEVCPVLKPSSGDIFGLAKRALHTSIPSELPCRETEINFIYEFVNQHLLKEKPGSLYISGAPGTGKTAVIQYILDKVSTSPNTSRKSLSFYKIFINCMNLASPGHVFEHIASELRMTNVNNSNLIDKLTTRITGRTGKMILLILDEMDQLLSVRGNEFLYKIFEMTRLPNSKLIVVGVANALDLTIRHLPMLATSSSPNISKNGKRNSPVDKETECQLLHFPPYEKEHIVHILEKRLASVGGEVFDQLAIKFVATKVASSTGDMRKALNACKTALDSMEKQQRIVFKATSDDGFNSSSPKKRCMNHETIGIGPISKILGPQNDSEKLPLQQILILATILRIHYRAPNSKHLSINGIDTAIPITTVYEEYRQICDTKGYEFIDMSDMISIFGMLEDRSLVSISKNPGTPSSGSKKGLKIMKSKGDGCFFDPKVVEFYLRQGDFLNAIVYSK